MEEETKKPKICVDIKELTFLKEKYPSTSEWLEKEVDRLQKYYEEHPFNNRNHKYYFEKIKEYITFINLDFPEEKLTKESSKEQVVTEEMEVKEEYLDKVREKKWGDASEVLVRYILSKRKIYTTKDDNKSEIWIYKNGVYLPNGKSEIKEMLRSLLGKWYSVFVSNMVLNKIEPDTFIDIEDFFNISYKDEVPVKNGLLNIFTRELNLFDDNKIFFNKLPVKYDPEAKCPKIDKFLSEVFTNKEDKNVFYELAGFGLLKEYKFEKAFMFVGDGRNGKGKTIELLKRLVGAYNCASEPLIKLVPESFSVSELHGKILNLAGDISNTDLKDTSMFKSLTGRDLVSGKRKFLKDIIFENYAKFVFACNELPMVYDLSMGFWDRWVLLEFPYTFVDQKTFDSSDNKDKLKIRDEDIISKIISEEELSGLLNAALDGLERLIKNKRFSSAKGCDEIKNMWIRKSNSFIAFCMDKLQEDYDAMITKKELRSKYAEYCKKHKVRSKSDYVIKKILQDMFGVTEDRKNIIGSNWEWYWMGVKWKN